jgi:hypothetical protein
MVNGVLIHAVQDGKCARAGAAKVRVTAPSGVELCVHLEGAQEMAPGSALETMARMMVVALDPLATFTGTQVHYHGDVQTGRGCTPPVHHPSCEDLPTELDCLRVQPDVWYCRHNA